MPMFPITTRPEPNQSSEIIYVNPTHIQSFQAHYFEPRRTIGELQTVQGSKITLINSSPNSTTWLYTNETTSSLNRRLANFLR